MVARREQGAVGNVSKGEWGNSKEKRYHKPKNSWKKVVENGKELSGGCMGEYLFHPPAARNQRSWVLVRRHTEVGCIDYCQGGRVQGRE